jgi:hypothetical protein
MGGARREASFKCPHTYQTRVMSAKAKDQAKLVIREFVNCSKDIQKARYNDGIKPSRWTNRESNPGPLPIFICKDAKGVLYH